MKVELALIVLLTIVYFGLVYLITVNTNGQCDLSPLAWWAAGVPTSVTCGR